MSANLDPQEIYLLQRYTSVEYFRELSDTWEALVAHLDACLGEFMRTIPPNYRRRPLPEQPDIGWGQRVLPNFRTTLQNLYSGKTLLSQGDFAGLRNAHGPTNDFKGQLDSWSGWMSESDQTRYAELLGKAVLMASNITITEGAHWNPQALTADYQENSRGPLAPPTSWPTFQTNPRINIASGMKTVVAGIYVPNIDGSCAQFLSPLYAKSPLATAYVGTKELFAPDTDFKYGERAEFERRPCIWNKVEQISESSAMAPTPSLLR